MTFHAGDPRSHAAPCFRRGRVVTRAYPGLSPRELLEACRWELRHAIAVAHAADATTSYVSRLIILAQHTVPVISRRAQCVGCGRAVGLLIPEITAAHRHLRTVCGRCAAGSAAADLRLLCI